MTGGQGYSFSRYSSGVLYGPDTVTDTRDSSVKETASQAELSLFSSRGSQTNSNAKIEANDLTELGRGLSIERES